MCEATVNVFERAAAERDCYLIKIVLDLGVNFLVIGQFIEGVKRLI